MIGMGVKTGLKVRVAGESRPRAERHDIQIHAQRNQVKFWEMMLVCFQATAVPLTLLGSPAPLAKPLHSQSAREPCQLLD